MRFSISLACFATVALAANHSEKQVHKATMAKMTRTRNYKVAAGKRTQEASEVPTAITQECMTLDAIYLQSESQACNKAWNDWYQFCSSNWNDDCNDAQDIYSEITIDSPELRIANLEECFTIDAHNYYNNQESEFKACNDKWKVWDNFCWENRGRDDCQAVNEAYEEAIKVPVPSKECMTEDAYYAESDSNVCNDAWRDYLVYCKSEKTDECSQVRKDIFEHIKARVPADECFKRHALIAESDKEACKEAYVDWNYFCSYANYGSDECEAVYSRYDAAYYGDDMNLAKFAEERGSSQFNYGVLVGSSVGAATALGAVYAMSRCGKASVDDFYRV